MRFFRSVIRWVKSLFTKRNMRRKISLYIAGQLVDLDDQSFILFNYQMDDLSNPTIVKNSMSQQITLKGTPTNNRVFGDAFKTDRRVANTGGQIGVDFNPSQKTPFVIYNEMQEILESGYVKLDSVSRKGADVQYKITLYGGLGSFFYALSYDENGNKRNLASLDYLGTSNPDAELDFVINADSIAEAWANLMGTAGQTLSTISTITGAILNADGTIESRPDQANWRVVDYATNGHLDILVTCTSPDLRRYAGAVALDSNSNPLKSYFGGEYIPRISDRLISLPIGTRTLRVFGVNASSNNARTPSVNPVWGIINFAPAYNGIPEGNFSPNKALVVPSSVGLQDTINVGGEMVETEVNGEIVEELVGGVDYTLKSGYALVNLAEAQDEWGVKDLRSYLQRPVFSMRAFWEAICDPDNNGGYEVDASAIQDQINFRNYSDLWMTLPLISSSGTIRQESGELSLSLSSSATSGNMVGRFNIGGSVPSGTKISASFNCKVRFNTPSGANSYSTLKMGVSQRIGRTTEGKFSVLFIQAVACGSDNSVIGGSPVKVIGGMGNSGEAMAQACGYTPQWAAGYEMMRVSSFTRVASGVFEIPQSMAFSIIAQDVAYYKIMVSVYSGTYTEVVGNPATYSYSGTGNTSLPVMYADFSTSFVPTSAYIVQGASANVITYTSSGNLRSGAIITKRMLLSTAHSPAEYMLSFCKIFGLYFKYDAGTRKITILKRNELYQDETIDLTRRVDMSKGYDIHPMVFKAKWYDFLLDGVGGAFYDEYLNVEGVPYGIQRVNTGYDFNSDAINLMDSVVFKNACTILARSKYFNYIFKNVGGNQVFQPSPFLDKGNTYTLWSADGDTLETDISCPPDSASVGYYNENPALKGYDIDSARKLELRDADNKPIDGADILVFHEGWNTYPYFKVTDDVPAMDVLNDGVPCWLLGEGGGAYIPIFQRYIYGNIHLIEHSLDFGYPRQMDIPGVRFYDGCAIYERGWKQYISDRYDVNTKVMTCRVDFTGIQVNQDLLRKFYWYDNSLWVLNAIKNYSLTTYDPVECEFIQVQDKENYLNGQNYR